MANTASCSLPDTRDSSMADLSYQFVCPDCGKCDFRTARGLTQHAGSGICTGIQAAKIKLQPRQADAPPQCHLSDLTNLRSTCRILRRVPKGARLAVADELTRLLAACNESDCNATWMALLTFAPRILTAPPTRGGRGPSLAISVKANLHKTTVEVEVESRARQRNTPTRDASLRKAVEAKLQDGDISGAVRLVSSEETIAPNSAETLEVLRSKHPNMPADLKLPEKVTCLPPQGVTREEVRRALASFGKGNGAGLDGLKPQRSPCWLNQDKLRVFDNIIFDRASTLVNVDISGRARTQASLPVRFGGLGLRSALDIALPAFLSSIHEADGLVDEIFQGADFSGMLDAAKTAWNESTQLAEDAVLEKTKQAAWDIPCLTKRLADLLDDTDVIAKARLLASSTKESGSWLHALPLSCVGNHLDDASFKAAIASRLGARIARPHRCICGQGADAYGHHALSCVKSRGRYKRQASLNEVIRRALSSASVLALLEPAGLANADGKRPDGLTQFTWKAGKCLI